jgi:CRP/FNR family cyclic AMP-dependent transcriptional regulator
MTERCFLDRLSIEDRAVLERKFVIRKHEPGEIVISHLDENQEVFFVLEGRLRATLYSLNGHEIDYRDIGPGDVVGELAAIDGAPRSATVEALEPARLGCLSAETFRNLIKTCPGLNATLLEHMSTQIRRLTERVFEFSTLSVRDRLISELLRLAEASSIREGRVEIHPVPTQFDLAHRISCRREVVSREMSGLAKAGLVKKRDRVLIISDLDQLRSLISDG